MSDPRPTATPGADLAVLVLGMHRSGTSAVAEALSAAGLDIGSADALMPPRLENPSFFGERLDVADLDDRLLSALGWTWDAPAAAPSETPPALDDVVADGRGLLSSLLSGGTRLFKDPRISVLLPWWRRMLLDRFVAVVTVRPPEEVAWSLAVRNGMPFELGLALWVAYHRHLAGGLDGLPVLLVDYDALTAEPEAVVGALLDQLEALGVDDGLDIDAAAHAIHPSLRRATQPTMSDDTLMSAVRAFAQAWSDGPVRAFDRFSMAAPPPMGWEVALLDVQRRFRHATLEADVAMRARDELAAALDEARTQVVGATTARERAEERLGELEAEAGSLRAALDESRAEVRAHRQEAAAASTDADEARIARREAEAARQKAEAATELADAARTDAAAARERAEAAARDASTAGDQAVVASATVAATLGAHHGPSVMRRVPGVGRVRHAARRFSDVLAVMPISSSLRRNPLFDARWYLDQYPDVRAAGLDPWRHYRRHGVAEGRDPNPWFRTARYLDENPDVRASRMNPLDHFLRHGAAEGRGPLMGSAGGPGRLGHPGERVGGGSDPPARSGLEGRRDEGVGRPDLVPSRRDVAHLGRWLASLVPARLPKGSTLLVVGVPAELRVEGITVVHLGGTDGSTPSSVPYSDTALIAQLEWQRSQGAGAIAVPVAASVWLDQVPGFRDHLEERYGVIARAPDTGILRDLRRTDATREPGVPAPTLASAVDAIRDGAGVPLSVLDRTAAGVSRRLEGVRVVDADPAVPWPPRSVDVVLQDAGTDTAEAALVAMRAVITLSPAPDEAPDVLRLEPELLDGARLSMVIPHYGPVDALRTCLAALRETTPGQPTVEVLVVDDASPDLDRGDLEACVAEMPGARLLVNETNAGFLQTANRGVAEATGDLVVLLNNDTLLLPGWLPALLRTFRERPAAGAVGGRLVYPDGRLQEAGGLVFRDGSAAKFGYRDTDPDRPMYTFLRDTDYVSGAFLATPRDLFGSLGGLDPVFGFGFYEDTDYCFRVRRAGRAVLYQPDCVVVHVEGATAGIDVSVGPKRSQVENQAVFRERWAEALRERSHRPRTARAEDWYAAALGVPAWVDAAA